MYLPDKYDDMHTNLNFAGNKGPTNLILQSNFVN